MSTRDIQRGEATAVEIFTSGDLSVSGWEQLWIQVGGADRIEDNANEPTAGAIRLRIDGDGRLRVPAGLIIRALDVAGDARIRGINAPVETGRIAGDLRIEDVHGEVRVGTVNGDTRVQSINGPIFISETRGDLDVNGINGPFSCDVTNGDAKIEGVNGPVGLTNQVNGDLAMAGINGPTTVGVVGGDLDIVDSDGAQIKSVNGDLTAKDLRSELHVARTGGDAQVADCVGLVVLDAVGGDLTAHELRGGIRATNVGGRIRLSTEFVGGQTYDLSGNATADVRLEGDLSRVSATFELRRNDGGRIDVGVPLADSVVELGLVRGRLGAGEATVRVTVNGQLRVEQKGQESHGFDGLEGIFDEIGEGFRGAFGAFSGFGWGGPGGANEDRGSRRGRRVEEKLEEATRRVAEAAERQGRHAAERAQRHVERAMRQAERGPGNWRWFGKPAGPGFGWPAPPAPPRKRASEDERLAILNMVAAGSITAEDAARLLEALGS